MRPRRCSSCVLFALLLEAKPLIWSVRIPTYKCSTSSAMYITLHTWASTCWTKWEGREERRKSPATVRNLWRSGWTGTQLTGQDFRKLTCWPLVLSLSLRTRQWLAGRPSLFSASSSSPWWASSKKETNSQQLMAPFYGSLPFNVQLITDPLLHRCQDRLHSIIAVGEWRPCASMSTALHFTASGEKSESDWRWLRLTALQTRHNVTNQLHSFRAAVYLFSRL